MESISTSDRQSRTETQRSSRMSTETQPELQDQSTDSSRRQAGILWKEDSPFVHLDSTGEDTSRSLTQALPRRQVQQTPSSAVVTSVNFAVAVVCGGCCVYKAGLSSYWAGFSNIGFFLVFLLLISGPNFANAAFGCFV